MRPDSAATARTFVPLYSQLARLIEDRIDANVLPPGTRLPNEAALAAEHGVSVITVRGALKVLIEKGRVERFPGRGTFVLERPAIRAAWGLGSIGEIDMTTELSEMEMLSSGTVPAPAWIGDCFGPPAKLKLPWMRNVRAVEGERFMVSDVYHDPAYGSLVRSARFRALVRERKLVVMALCELAGVALGDVRQVLSATLAEADIAAALQLPTGAPLLVVQRHFCASDGRVIQAGLTHYRVDHYRYNLNLRLIQERRATGASARRRLLEAVPEPSAAE